MDTKNTVSQAASDIKNLRRELDEVLTSLKDPDPPAIEEILQGEEVEVVTPGEVIVNNVIAEEVSEPEEFEPEEHEKEESELLLEVRNMVKAIYELKQEITKKRQWTFVINRDQNQLITSVTANG